MQLQPTSEAYGNSDYSWLANRLAVGEGVTTRLHIASADKTTHYPDGFIKAGTILAQFTSGANNGLFAPYVHDHAGGEGLDTPAGIALSDFAIHEVDGVATSATTIGSMIPANMPCRVFVSRLPGLLDNLDAAYAPVAADLPAGVSAAQE